jgi:DNA-binding SARP family transcriptional activator
VATRERNASAPAAGLQIRLFGAAQLLFGQEVRRFRAPPRTLPLLAYLILHRAKPVRREVAAFTLWPDDDETSARANLRRHLHYLQNALPQPRSNQPWVLAEGRSTLGWNPRAACEIDVVEFERLSASDTFLEDADRLYAGDLLADLSDEWILYDRERLRGIELTNLDRLIASARRDGDFPRALRYAQRLLAMDPWREDAVRQAMELRYASGDRAGALAEFESFARRLRNDLDADPMPETVACYDSIVRNAAVLQPPRDERRIAGDGPAPKSELPFVGRDSELEQLRVWWTRAARGSGTLGLVSGEAGIGKTRLLSELKELAESEGGRVLVGATASFEAFAYEAVLDALSSATNMVATLNIDPIWISVVADLIPDLAARRPDLETPTVAPDQVRTRLFEAIFQVLGGLAAQRPLLLVLEDLHWARAATIDLLEFLSQRIGTTRLLIVASYRDEEVARAHPLRRLRRHARPSRRNAYVAIGPITQSAVETLVAKLMRRLPVAREWVPLLYERSEGNPLFLAQLIAAAVERGSAAPLHELVPGGLGEVIRSRLAPLTRDTRSLALMAAVIGDAFDIELLQEVTGWNAARVSAGIGELLERRLIRDTGLHDIGDFTFSHHLIEATIYAEASQRDLTHRHARVAVALEELYPARLDDLSYRIARHFVRGASPQRAAEYYARASRFALQRWAYDDAVAHATKGLELATLDATKISLLLLREEAHARRGDTPSRNSDLNDLSALAASDNVELRCEIQRRRIEIFHTTDRRAEESTAIAEFKSLAARSLTPQARVESLYAGARFLMVSSRTAEALAECRKALELAAGSGDLRAQTRSYSLLADIFDRSADFVRAHEALATAQRLTDQLADPALQLAVLLMSCRLANWQNHYDELDSLGSRMLELSLASGDRSHEGTARNVLGVVAMYRFVIPEARRYFAESREIFTALGRPRNVIAAQLNQTLLLMRTGNLEEAIDLGKRTTELATAAQANLFREGAICAVAEAYLRKGDVESAHAAASEALELSAASQSRNFAPAAFKVARCEAARGNFKDAMARIDAALALAEGPGLEVQKADALADRAGTALKAGLPERALESVEVFLPIVQNDPGRFAEPEVLLLVAAQVFRANENQNAASTPLATAWDIYQSRLAGMDEERSRAAYAALWFHRELQAAIAALPTHS